MLVAREPGGRGGRESVFNGNRVSVFQEKEF